MIEIITDVKYRLLNLESGTYLTLSSSDDTSIVGQAYLDGTNQLWTFEGSGTDEVYYIKSVETGAYAGVLAGDIVEGQQVIGISAPFGWKVVSQTDMGAATRFAVSADTSLYMDLTAGSSDDGTPVILFHETGDNQVWVLAQTE